MKKIFYALLLISLISCVQKNEINPDKETDSDKIASAEKLLSTVDFSVPIQEGCITTVSYNGMVLARTSRAMTIKVPKGAVNATDGSTSGLDIETSEGQAPVSFSNLWQTVMFEDSKTGDYDYNDLVFHVNYQTTGNIMKVYIQPIAFGTRKDFKLRMKWKQDGIEGVVKVAESCRKELFGGQDGYINTQSYDECFPEFAKEFTIELPSEASAVDISWFINIEDFEAIYAVNNNGDRCLNNDGMPYGFVVTDVQRSNVAKSKSKKKSIDEDAWNEAKPNVSTWANMQNMPTIPLNTLDLPTNINAILPESNYILKAGESCKGDLNAKSGTNFYIEGTFTITKYNSDNIPYGSIYVMPGGTLELDLSNSDGLIDRGNIINYGTIIWKNKDIKLSNGSLYTTAVIDDSSLQIKLQDYSILYVGADAILKEISINDNSTTFSKAYFGSLKTENITNVNNGILYVNGGVQTNNFITKGGTGTVNYVDCRLNALSKIDLQIKSELYVKGSIYTPEFNIGNQGKVYLASDGMMDAEKLTINAVGQNAIYTIGSDVSMVSINDFYAFKNLGKFFNAPMDVFINKAYMNNVLDSVCNYVIGDEAVLVNNMNVKVPKTSCSPGFNPNNDSNDNGAVWFAFPMEGVKISDCYDFEKWKVGNFDFTKLPSATVFDVDNQSPIRGGSSKIYQVTR